MPIYIYICIYLLVDSIHSCNLILYLICFHLFQVWKQVCSHFWLALKLIHYFTSLFLHATKNIYICHWYICVYIYICIVFVMRVYIYICIYTYISWVYVFIYTCINMCIYIYIYTLQICVCVPHKLSNVSRRYNQPTHWVRSCIILYV